jgi:hypothetical protein
MTRPVVIPDDFGLMDPSKLTDIAPITFRIPLMDTEIVGICFRGDPEEITAGLKEWDLLSLVREPDNPYDRRAVKVLNQDGMHIGYIPRDRNETVANLMDAGKHLYCEITGIGGFRHDPCVRIRVLMDDL